MEIEAGKDKREPLIEGMTPWIMRLDYPGGGGKTERQVSPAMPLLTFKHLVLHAADGIGVKDGNLPAFPIQIELHYFHPGRTDVLMNPEIGADSLYTLLRKVAGEIADEANFIMDTYLSVSAEEKKNMRLHL